MLQINSREGNEWNGFENIFDLFSILYADDTIIYSYKPSILDILNSLQQEFDSIQK